MGIRTIVAVIICSALLGWISNAHAAEPAKQPATTAVATFAAGCFWCTEAAYDKVPGVITTISGFMGGHVKNPTYRQVSHGGTGHTEVVQVTYDPEKVTYEQLLDVFWRNVDPVDGGGQFCDRGDQYRPEIFTHTPQQKKLAEASKKKLETSGQFKQPIAVAITDASAFTAADDHHQDFHMKSPMHYWSYRIGCGRDQRLEAVWGKKPKT